MEWAELLMQHGRSWTGYGRQLFPDLVDLVTNVSSVKYSILGYL
jgi:hypothetical protein